MACYTAVIFLRSSIGHAMMLVSTSSVTLQDVIRRI